jgi:hypothetical protein
MIFKSTSQLSPTVDISIDGTPVDYMQLQKITLELNENMHDLAVLEFTGIDPTTIDLYLDAPIKFSVDLPDRDSAQFYGYIIFVEPVAVASEGTVDGSPFQVMRAFCLGASYRMKGLRSRVWENVTLSEIATTLANKYQFSVSCPDDSYRFPRLVQSAQSDWAFLVNAALRLGYAVSVRGTHLHIWDAYKSLERKISYSTLYTIRGTKGNAMPIPGQIVKFSGRIGNVTTEGSRSVDTIHTLTKTGDVISVSNELTTEFSGMGSPVNRVFYNDLNAFSDSYEMSDRLVTGAMRRKFPMTADLTVVADPSISPGGIVGIREYNAKFDGYWYVRSVTHEILHSNMVTHLKIAKDSLDGINATPLHVSEYVDPPKPALIQGSWVSEKDMVSIYA